MAEIKSVERKINAIEEFAVTIRHGTGKDVRGDKQGIPSYDYERAAPGTFTVKEWIEKRFKQAFAGFEVTVWLGDGTEAHGVTRLSTVRESY